VVCFRYGVHLPSGEFPFLVGGSEIPSLCWEGCARADCRREGGLWRRSGQQIVGMSCGSRMSEVHASAFDASAWRHLRPAMKRSRTTLRPFASRSSSSRFLDHTYLHEFMLISFSRLQRELETCTTSSTSRTRAPSNKYFTRCDMDGIVGTGKASCLEALQE
jgi:hypothetical protein